MKTGYALMKTATALPDEAKPRLFLGDLPPLMIPKPLTPLPRDAASPGARGIPRSQTGKTEG